MDTSYIFIVLGFIGIFLTQKYVKNEYLKLYLLGILTTYIFAHFIVCSHCVIGSNGTQKDYEILLIKYSLVWPYTIIVHVILPLYHNYTKKNKELL